MIKSPTQWAKTFQTISNSQDVSVKIQMTVEQAFELAVMMEQLALRASVDDIKEILEVEKSI